MVTQQTWNGRRIWGKAALLASLVAVAIPVTAATQGTLGASSTGSLEISLVISPMIQVSQLQDIQLASMQGESVAGSTPLCVSGNYEGDFQLEAQGSGSNNEFQLASGGDSVDYEVSLQGEAESVELDSMVPSQALSLGSCEDTRSLLVAVDGADTVGVEPGVYNGTLTLLV